MYCFIFNAILWVRVSKIRFKGYIFIVIDDVSCMYRQPHLREFRTAVGNADRFWAMLPV